MELNGSSSETIHIKNAFRLQIQFHANQTHFHIKGFARRLVLKKKHKVLGNAWPIGMGFSIKSRDEKLTLLLFKD